MLGNGNNESNKTYVNLKLVSVPGPISDKNDAPKLVVLGDNFQPTDKTFTKIKGKLNWIKSTFTPKKGKMGDIYGFKAFIEDGEEVYVIESTITNASKDLLNSLLSAKDKVVDISLYLNKNGYPTSSTRGEDGDFIAGALDFKSLTPQVLTDAINSTFVKKEEVSNEINVEDIPF